MNGVANGFLGGGLSSAVEGELACAITVYDSDEDIFAGTVREASGSTVAKVV